MLEKDRRFGVDLGGGGFQQKWREVDCRRAEGKTGRVHDDIKRISESKTQARRKAGKAEDRVRVQMGLGGEATLELLSTLSGMPWSACRQSQGMLYPGEPCEWEATEQATEGAMVLVLCVVRAGRIRGLTYMAVIDWPESNERVGKGCSTRG
jgi:hypothetical protein